MNKIFKKETLGTADYGWLIPRYHFSFASYYNPSKVRVGSLRVLNDDLIKPYSGFDTHPHNDMEIVTYVINGELTHEDSMGNKRKLSRGQVQYMSAGNGVMHSEHNEGSETLRLLQIWLYPNQKGLKPNYGDKLFSKDDRYNKLFNIVSGQEGNGEIKINQTVEIVVGEFEKAETFHIDKGEYDYFYFVQIEGESTTNEHDLYEGDGFLTDNDLTLQIKGYSHFLFLKIKEI